ncbi:MAG TPA: 3-phosphoshikimate 1-carboxyvinyltransferase [Nitrospirales bacterium]|nr:3-phosphoshikimate 1-carboxyvinyltransferase [Nitrospirales bacterium]HIB53717.1 3-phosphoshikimate 1-carboxyvinyltransferase [Nitrospirales bacterium]HIN33538.1 3-phosphoshikimate 1-carboxyvinyltransferase [Nitrospirales bacterium]HIO21938.1 3-phosphoshikimate 1-carboxyvinyltransferase [Nitrospirales bacterium]
MSRLTITPSGPINSAISIPGDKSITHRAVIFSAMAEGTCTIRGYCDGEDCFRTINAIRALGVSIEVSKTELRVFGKGLWGFSEPQHLLDCGNSGTSMRLLTGLLSGQDFFSVLTGDRSLRQRPMGRIVTPLRQMGAMVSGRKGGELAPLAIQGVRLSGVSYTSPIASAQVKSAILIAGLLAEQPTTFHEPARSRDHTERVLQYFGVQLDHESDTTIRLHPSALTARDVAVPGDFSSAAFFIVAGLILPDSRITIRNVGLNHTRVGLLDILKTMGASIQTLNIHDDAGEPVGDIHIQSSQLEGTDIDPKDMLRAIDEFPILCVAAALAKGHTRITGMEDLRVKESDRITTMAQALGRVGVDVDEHPDGLVIHGRGQLHGAECPSHGDHRVAMAMAIAGLNALETTTITDIDCIQTSFPGFLNELQQIAPTCRVETS